MGDLVEVGAGVSARNLQRLNVLREKKTTHEATRHKVKGDSGGGWVKFVSESSEKFKLPTRKHAEEGY